MNGNLRSQLTKALSELIKHYVGESPRIVDGALADLADQICATIDFSHPSFRGSIVAAAVTEDIKRFDEHARDADDWLREFVNQLGGRLKNKLMQYRTTVSLGVPFSIQEDDLLLVHDCKPPGCQHWTVTTTVAGLGVTLRFEGSEPPDWTLDEDSTAAEEGTLMLF